MTQEQNRRNDGATILVIAERINLMQNDVSDLRDTMKDSMKEMSTAVIKLVQMEERQIYMNQSYERLTLTLDKMHTKSEKLEERVDALEREQPMQKQVTKWIIGAVGSIVLAAASFVAKMLGLF